MKNSEEKQQSPGNSDNDPFLDVSLAVGKFLGSLTEAECRHLSISAYVDENTPAMVLESLAKFNGKKTCIIITEVPESENDRHVAALVQQLRAAQKQQEG